MSDFIRTVIGILLIISPIYIFIGVSLLVDYIEKIIERKNKGKNE